MDYKEFEMHVAAYAEGLLGPKLMAEMEAKRAECSRCDELARVHETILGALSTAEPLKAPAGLEQSILAAVEAEQAEALDEKRVVRRALAVSLAVVASIIACAIPLLSGFSLGELAIVQDSSTRLQDLSYAWASVKDWAQMFSAFYQLAMLYISTMPEIYQQLALTGAALVVCSTCAWAYFRYLGKEQLALSKISI